MQTVSVTCSAGEIQGRVKEEALLFAGIPYAQPPVGNLRFKAPQALRLFQSPIKPLSLVPQHLKCPVAA